MLLSLRHLAFIALSLTGIGLMVKPISSATTCGLSIANKVLNEKITKKYNIFKKHYQKGQQTIKSFVKLYRKYLQDNVIGKNENECLCNIFTKYMKETRTEFFYNYEHKKNLIFLVIIN